MKQDYFSANNIKHVDFKDVEILRKFMNPNARIQSRKKSGLSAKNQRKVSLAIKQARFMGLLPYVAR